MMKANVFRGGLPKDVPASYPKQSDLMRIARRTGDRLFLASDTQPWPMIPRQAILAAVIGDIQSQYNQGPAQAADIARRILPDDASKDTLAGKCRKFIR